MKITGFLCKDAIEVDLQAIKKKETLKELIDKLVVAKRIKENAKEKILQALLDREKLGSTGIGQGVAIPHAKTDKVTEIVCAFATSRKGIEFDALDGEKVYIIFLLIAPQDSAGMHLKVLAKISRLLKDKFFRQALREAKAPSEVVKIIKEEDVY
jgi:fructose-specific phosphotransferase system IIA component